MVTTHVLASPDQARAAAAQQAGALAIGLYQMGKPPVPGVGHAIPHSVQRLPRSPSIRVWDFLSFALAVFGADRFVLRDRAEDGWTRVISLTVELAEPDPWQQAAGEIGSMLRFLTGDIWQLAFSDGGAAPPAFQSRLSDRTAVTLFSGGMDSLIGALDLVSAGEHPLLVSSAARIEGQVQSYLAAQLGLSDNRFDGHVAALGLDQYELSARARSILFLAYGVVAAADLTGELVVPENGLISINPPLTRRRHGSLSTRTTHPHFISSLQGVLDRVGVPVRLRNPYGFSTKGEMLAACGHPQIAQLASHSWSCGKGNRKNQQCGKCVPCLIRRASFLAAAQADATNYQTMDLSGAVENDDVQAARFAAAQLATRDLSRWVSEAGPLPHDPVVRSQYVDVVGRGLAELKELVDSIQWP